MRWDLLQKVAVKQDAENFALGNKLTQRRHINWKLSPMTVRYAVETLSNSVADVLEQLCEDKYEDFVGSGNTVQFIRLNNDLFDVMNYGDGKKTNNQFKQPISKSTMPVFLELFERYREFVNEISVERINDKRTTKKVLKSYFWNKSKSFVGFFGFLQNIASVIGIYTDYIQNGSLDIFYAFQFSQDSLETFFSLVRSSLGANTNPNAEQFMAAYRKLLMCMPHMSSRHTNCSYFDISNILTVSSAQTPNMLSHNDIINASGIEIDSDYETLISNKLDPYELHMCAYLSSVVQANIIRKIKARLKSACQDCVYVFNENCEIYDSFIEKKKKSGQNLNQPCRSTFHIIVACNSIFKILQAIDHVEYNVMAKTILNNLNIEALYESSEFNSHQYEYVSAASLTHKDYFVFDVVEEFMRMKSINIGRRITDEEWSESVKKRRARRVKILDGR